MRQILLALVLLMSIAGCDVGNTLDPSAFKKEWPAVNLPDRAAAKQLARSPGPRFVCPRHDD